MNNSFLSLSLMACISSGHATESFDFQHLREYQKLAHQYSQEGNSLKAAETDAQLRRLLPKIIPNIIKDLPSISQHRQNLLSIYLRTLPDEDYLNVAQCLVQHVNFNNSEQVQFLENILFEPFESSRDNFFAMNWRNAKVRQLCKQLQGRIDPKNPIHGKMTAILNGEEFRNMMREALRGDFRIPVRLPHRDDEPQFQKWEASEKDQMTAINNLRGEWDKACKALLDMKGKEDVDQVAQAWKKATGAAEKVMNMLPPPVENARHRVGLYFYENFFKECRDLAQAGQEPDSTYQKVLHKFLKFDENDKELWDKLMPFGEFYKTISNTDSYLNEEAVYLHTEGNRQDERSKRLSRGR